MYNVYFKGIRLCGFVISQTPYNPLQYFIKRSKASSFFRHKGKTYIHLIKAFTFSFFMYDLQPILFDSLPNTLGKMGSNNQKPVHTRSKENNIFFLLLKIDSEDCYVHFKNRASKNVCIFTFAWKKTKYTRNIYSTQKSNQNKHLLEMLWTDLKSAISRFELSFGKSLRYQRCNKQKYMLVLHFWICMCTSTRFYNKRKFSFMDIS